MPHTFVHLFPELELACQTSLVLTTTERLRRNLILTYNARQQASGKKAWPTPRVQTLDGYLGALHAAMRMTEPTLPNLLGSEAEYQLFRATAPRGGERLVPLAQQAWQLCRQWQIPLEPGSFNATDNGRTFLNWCERIERRLEAGNAITRAQLAGAAHLLSAEPSLSCLAFEGLPAAASAWLDRQGELGTRVVHLTPPASVYRMAARTTFDSEAEELAAVAHWVRNLLLEADEGLRVGVVVPDLAARHTSVVRQFTAELDPLLERGTDGLVDVGGGTPLAEQPVWQSANRWLTLCYDRLVLDQAVRCLRDKYLALQTATPLPATLPPIVDLSRLTLDLKTPSLDALSRQLPEAVARPLGDWLLAFLEILQQAGWNGRQAGSQQYQAYQELRARTEALAGSAGNRTAFPGEALQILNDYLATVVFAPERSPAPVQIMGYLETTGLRFSHLWIMGLDDQTWPQSPVVNPFIPAAARKRYQVARSTPEQETAFARERIAHWEAASDQLIISHARHSAESRLRPSPLIRRLPETTLLALQKSRVHPYFEHRHGHLESVDDDHGTPLEPGVQRGGTGRIRDQALCPIKGYAIHRLGLKEERQPHGLPDALDRGTLIHEALHRLYEDARHAGLTPAALAESAFARAADQALRMHYERFPRAFRERERARLIALLGVWNQLEARRTDASIEALELGVSAEFDAIGLRLRIDRMDRIGDALVVIDYKTGRVGNRLTRDRLVDPQLPLYALCNEEVQGVLYAEVNDARPGLKGIADLDIDEASLIPPANGSWTAQRRRWREQIDTLAGEIRAGFAAVAPFEPNACQNCHLQAFCRIELDAAPDDDGASYG